MTAFGLTLLSERWLDEVLLVGIGTPDSGAPISDTFSIPSGLGDVAIMCVELSVTTIDVLTADAQDGARITIVAGTSIVDLVGLAPFLTVSDTANALQRFALIVPDHLVLCRQGEVLSVVAPEQDTDATPTADWFIRVKAVRVRPKEGVPSPLRLVR